VFLHLLAGEGVWGRGRHLSPRPQQPFRNLFVVLFVHKNLDRCASIFGLAFGFLLEFFRGAIAQRRVQPLPIVILFDEPFVSGVCRPRAQRGAIPAEVRDSRSSLCLCYLMRLALIG
jgi:hypothetical protein